MIKQQNMKKEEIMLEEYRYLCKEKERYYKERDYSTIASLTIGIPLIGFGINQINSDNDLMLLPIYFVIPLLLFLYLFVRYFWTDLLGLKIDAFIRYKIEKEIPDLNWFTKKAGYSLGKTKQLHQISLIVIYLSFISANLWLIYKSNIHVFRIGVTIALIVIIITLLLKMKMNDKQMMKNWKNKFSE